MGPLRLLDTMILQWQRKKEPAKSLGDIQISTPVTLYSSSPADAQADREHLGGGLGDEPDAVSRVVLSLLWHPWLPATCL